MKVELTITDGESEVTERELTVGQFIKMTLLNFADNPGEVDTFSAMTATLFEQGQVTLMSADGKSSTEVMLLDDEGNQLYVPN